jgi:hypothetical protein
MFVGIGRSGTTLLGALLDAHPNVVIANQQCVLKYLYPFPFSRERIYRLLLRNSVNLAGRGRPGGGGYSYALPGQWQGKFERIEVIGDKSRSAQSVAWLASRPALLQKLAQTARARIRMLHIIRNPFDTIARRSLRRHVSLERISREYFALTEQLQALIGRLESEAGMDVKRIQVYLEDLIGDPASVLTTICDELGVRAPQDYLRACAGLVYQKPREARTTVDWSAELLSDINARLREFPYLSRYSPAGTAPC